MLAPYRMQQLGHLQLLACYWAPLVLFALHRYRRDPRRRWLALFGLAWAGQSLSNGYALFHLSILVVLWVIWFMRPLRTALPVALAWACAAVPLAPLLWRYRLVHDGLHLQRDINEVKRFGADLADFVAAPPELVLWGERLATARPETALFPGLTGRRCAAVMALVVSGILLDGWVRVPVAAAPQGPPPIPAGVSAVLELPPGDAVTDFGALARAMRHGVPLVNGYSGYVPPHYLPLAHAVRDAEWSALGEVADA